MSVLPDRIPVYFLHDDAVPLFFGSQAARFGGAEVQIFYLAQALAKNPLFQVTFLTERDFPPQAGEILFRTMRCNNQKLQANIPPEKSRATKPRGVIIQRIVSLNTEKARELARLMNLEFIYHVSSDEDVVKCSDVHDLNNDFQRYIFDASVIVLQHRGQREILRSYSDHRVQIVPNCIPFPNEASSYNGKHVLWAGRCAPIKRPWSFLELARLFPSEKFLMLLKEDSHYPSLYQAVRTVAELVPNVRLVDAPFFESQEYFDSAKMLVSTSSMEGFPNTFLQAAAGAIPIVSLSVDPRPMFGDCSSYLYADGSMNTCAEQVRLLLKDSDLAKHKGRLGFNFAKEAYNVDGVAERYARLIIQVAGTLGGETVYNE